MKAHIIENNKVVNTIEVESLDFLPNLIDASIGGTIGWEIVNGIPITPIVPIQIPQEIRIAQCRAQLIMDGNMAGVTSLLAGITDPIKKELYTMYFEYEPIVKRDNPMINEMAPMLGIDLDVFFINASKL